MNVLIFSFCLGIKRIVVTSYSNLNPQISGHIYDCFRSTLIPFIWLKSSWLLACVLTPFYLPLTLHRYSAWKHPTFHPSQAWKIINIVSSTWHPLKLNLQQITFFSTLLSLIFCLCSHPSKGYLYGRKHVELVCIFCLNVYIKSQHICNLLI